MTAFYSRLQSTANRLLTSKGKTLTVRRTGSGTFDPVTGQETVAGANTDNTPKGVILPLTKIDDNRYLKDLVEGKLRKVLVAAADMTFEPRAGDKVIDGSTTIEVFGCTPLNPAGTPLIYTMKGKVVA